MAGLGLVAWTLTQNLKALPLSLVPFWLLRQRVWVRGPRLDQSQLSTTGLGHDDWQGLSHVTRPGRGPEPAHL